ncbi:MAG TPA: hypothetical protein VIT93_06390 [Dehalococcoidia bacterium]
MFDSDGAVIAPADLKTKAGIKSIQLSTNRRAIKIKTVKDDHDPPVERIVIRVKGMRPGGGSFWDYFRVVIVHERGAKANKLATEFMESSVAFVFEEDEATMIAYASDSESLILHEAPIGDAIFDDIKVICDTGGTTAVAHPFHGSVGFIQDYPGGQSSDVFYIPASQIDNANGGPCPPQVAANVTNFGPDSPFFILDATACDDKVLFTELNTEAGTFRLGSVWYDGNGLGPVPGGDSHRDPSCFSFDSQVGAVASTPGTEGRSNGAFVPILPCNATCAQGTPSPKVILPADGPDVHMRGLAVSPDSTKIAWYRSTASESQVWVGEFDSLTQTVSNHTQLTTEGNNYDPTWSPRGDQIAFFSDRDGNFEIYVMNTDGSDQANITNTPGADETEPSWQVP